jgi:hypothetical protein
MAYLRLTDSCKVYFFDRVGGGWECCGCLLMPPDHKDISVQLNTLDEVYPHLAKHVVRGHITLHEADRVGLELRGEVIRRTDVVINEMVRQAQIQGDGATRIVSDDADVPAEMRWTTKEFAERMLEEARAENDGDTVAGLEKLLAMLKQRGVTA